MNIGPFPPSYFFLHVSLESFYWSSNSLILSLAVPCLLINSSIAFLHFHSVFLNSSISSENSLAFWSFHFSPYPSVLACSLLFPLEPLTYRPWLNSIPYNSNSFGLVLMLAFSLQAVLICLLACLVIFLSCCTRYIKTDVIRLLCVEGRGGVNLSRNWAVFTVRCRC